MMKKKSLVLLCENYPLSAGEFFIDDELRVLSVQFDKIFVIIKEQEHQSLHRFVPDNLKVITYRDEFRTIEKIKSLSKIFSKTFFEEMFYVLFKYHVKARPMLFKILFNYIYSAKKIKSIIQNLIFTYELCLDETVFYSYWHDDKAFALAQMCRENKNFKAVARAHGSDIYFNAQKYVSHKFPYLPFKKFIIDNITLTFTVSKHGKVTFEKLLGKNNIDKIKVAYLGKANERDIIMNKKDDRYVFCSCSSIIPVKRLHLIIDILSELNLQNVEWIHFGDGRLRSNIEAYAKEKIPNIRVKLSGKISNKEILDFYSNNYIDLFLNVSESEGVPVAIMEALSAGIPVLATKVGGVLEAVPENVGFLIDKDFSASTAAEIIRSYLNLSPDLRKEFRLNAHEYWKNNFDALKNYTLFAQQLYNL